MLNWTIYKLFFEQSYKKDYSYRGGQERFSIIYAEQCSYLLGYLRSSKPLIRGLASVLEFLEPVPSVIS